MNKKIRFAAVFTTFALVLSMLSGCLYYDELYVEDDNYESYDSSSSYTLMVYLCGSDLESRWGAGTADLREMIEGFNGNESVNIIVQTGGSLFWQNPIVSAEKCQHFRVTKNTLELIDDSAGRRSMSDPATLGSFISYASQAYKADRYGLILWNHGGGSAGGYGYDEAFGSDPMNLSDLSDTLGKSGLTFDFIGFDACLMAGFETCLAVAPYTKYLIASQESEPGCGWYYKDFVRALATTPSIGTTELGKIIVDTYIEKAYESAPSTYSTLGVFDTEKIVDSVLPLVNAMSESYTKQLKEGNYSDISRERSNVREMADANDYVDLCGLADESGNSKLRDALADATVCFGSTPNGTGDNGLSIYYPYYDLTQIDAVDNVYESVEYDVQFDDYIDYFANVMAGGQIALDSGHDESSFSGFDWFDFSDAYDSSIYSDEAEDYGTVEVKESGDDYILELSDDDWDGISNITLNCFASYNDYYIDFGADDYYELDKDGNLIVGYDERWVALNGSIVPFFFEEHYSDDNGDLKLSYGYVPCVYNDKDAQLVLAWDADHPEGYAAGVRYTYDNPMIAPRGMTEIKDGDVIKPYYDLYDENMHFVDKATLDGEEIKVDGKLTVSYEDVRAQLGDTFIFYEIFDLFNNSYDTEPIFYEE